MTLTQDERLTLPLTATALLCCIRLEVLEMKHGRPAAPQITDILTQLGAPNALPHLAGFLAALSTGATRMINVQCTCKPTLTPDEHALLQALALSQTLQTFEARLILRTMATPPATTTPLRLTAFPPTLH
jgi:hypothetical protein